MLGNLLTRNFIKKSVSISALALAIVGCTSTPNEYIELRSKDAEDYALNPDEFSEPTRFLYPIMWVKPSRNANNLDNFYEDVDVRQRSDSTLSNTASAATLVGAGMGKITSFNALMGLLAQQGTSSGYSVYQTEQFLYTVVPVDTSKDLDTQGKAAGKIAINTVRAVQGNDAKETYLPADFYPVEGTRLVGAKDESCEQVRSPCSSMTFSMGRLIRGNEGYIPLVPQGDYMVIRTYLPMGFPVEQLKFAGGNNVEQFLYVPAIKMVNDEKVWTKENIPYITEWYKKERISINPYLKRLSDDTVFYFSPKITAKQKDSHSLYRVFNLSE